MLVIIFVQTNWRNIPADSQTPFLFKYLPIGGFFYLMTSWGHPGDVREMSCGHAGDKNYLKTGKLPH